MWTRQDDGGWAAGEVGGHAGLERRGDAVALFAWDGAADLVRDVDLVAWCEPGRDCAAVDKSGVAVDGPDADDAPTTYLADTPADAQAPAPAPDDGRALARLDLTEGAEAAAAGNGPGGDDETAEPWATTFVTAAPTPGTLD